MIDEHGLRAVARTERGDRYSRYDRFASVYDEHFGHYPGRAWPAIERLLLAQLPSRARVLDLCCGTGQLAAMLLARGLRVTGLDGSQDMLRVAAENAPALQCHLADARSFDLPDSFDAVVSTFDSLNHVLSLAELTAVFANVYRALRPGGTFLFDLNMEQGFRLRWWGTFRTVDRGRVWTVRAIYDPERRIGENRVTVVDADQQPCDEFCFQERCYREAEIRAALCQAGFNTTDVYDGHQDLGLFGEFGRAFFVCRKAVTASES